MPEVTATPVAFKEANEFLKNKLRIPTRRSDELQGAIHAKAFTVAGATKAQLLKDLHQSVSDAIEQGQSIGDFRKTFDSVVATHGWSYRGARGWRTRVIYDTNIRSAHMAGKWSKIQQTKARRPYLEYLTAGDTKVRAEHRVWDHLILPVDDPFWKTHTPLNGWGCRCDIRSRSQREMERLGLTVSKAPKIEFTERINTRTGEVYGPVPKGIDTGFEYNVGESWLAPEQAFGETIAQLSPRLRSSALESLSDVSDRLVKPYTAWAREVLASDSAGSQFTIGYLSNPAVEFLTGKGLKPETITVTVLDHRLRRMGRSVSRRSGKSTLPEEVLLTIPERFAHPLAVLWDIRKRNLAYVVEIGDQEGLGRLVVSIDFVRKGQPTNALLSGSIIPLSDLQDGNRYEVVEGGL